LTRGRIRAKRVDFGCSSNNYLAGIMDDLAAAYQMDPRAEQMGAVLREVARRLRGGEQLPINQSPIR